MTIKGHWGSWGGAHRTAVAVIAAAIRARERRIRATASARLWAKLLEGRGTVWLAGGPRVRARGGAGPRDSEGARRERSRGSWRGEERRKVEEGALTGGALVSERERERGRGC